METSLHRQLKELYAGEDAMTEVVIGNYRIDAIQHEELVEIQHGSLAAIRDKIKELVEDYPVRVVKPIIAKRRLIKRAAKGKQVVGRRLSPKRGTLLDLFSEMVYFTNVFPHPNLVLEVPLVEIEEWRYPGHGRRRRRRRDDHQIEDQKLVGIESKHVFHSAHELANILPTSLKEPFHTGNLAESLEIERHDAQQIAYCLRETGGIVEVGKDKRAILYERSSRAFSSELTN